MPSESTLDSLLELQMQFRDFKKQIHSILIFQHQKILWIVGCGYDFGLWDQFLALNTFETVIC